ncbi:hypothetical protein D6777_03210 [Candidatus Woesearchaeota archaeon]|nr:MAG: hypothetical protein D6777_03210 [Candidatus Woesearchaeota archaeon]
MAISRRKFFKRIFKYAILAGGTYVGYNSGLSGVKEDLRYFYNIIQPKKKPKDKLLFDQHFHMTYYKNKNDLEKVVEKMITATDFVSVAMHGSSVSKGETNYEGLVEQVKSLNMVEFSDRYATIIRKGDKSTMLIRSQEVYTMNPDYPKQQVHFNVAGMDYVRTYMQTEKFLDIAFKQSEMVTLNHPYAVPNKYVKYWLPNSREEEHLIKLVNNYDLFVEGHNMMCVLHLAAANAKAKKLAFNAGRVMLAGTDTHRAKRRDMMKMVGNAGVLIDDCSELKDWKSLTGKEMVQRLANYIKYSEVQLLDNYVRPLTFYNVMVKRRDLWD